MGSLVTGVGLGLLAAVVGWRVMPWLRAGRHRYDDESDRPLRRHTWVVPVAGVAGLLIGIGWGTRPVHALVFASYAVFLVLVSAIDLDVQRLPDRWTRPAGLAAPAATAVLAVIDGDLGAWLRGLLAGLALGGLYLLLVILGGGSGMGLGDAKLAPSIGVVLGYLSWAHVIIATLAAILVGGLVALVLVLTRRGGRGSHFAFGPAMAAGAVFVLAARSVATLSGG